MGPVKFASAIFGSVSSVVIAILGAFQTTAETVDIWANTAKEASELTSEHMLNEIRHENSKKAKELQALLALDKPSDSATI